MKLLTAYLMIPLLLAGCSFRSEQLDMARQMAPGGDSVDVNDYAWRLKFNETETQVYAISVGSGIVFANEQGLEVAFDGWDVLVVSGMPGSLGSIRVDKTVSPRVHHVEGLDESFEVACEEPERVPTGWHVDCRHEGNERVYAMDHDIRLSSDGRITRISASLIPGVGPVVLEPMFEIGE